MSDRFQNMTNNIYERIFEFININFIFLVMILILEIYFYNVFHFLKSIFQRFSFFQLFFSQTFQLQIVFLKKVPRVVNHMKNLISRKKYTQSVGENANVFVICLNQHQRSIKFIECFKYEYYYQFIVYHELCFQITFKTDVYLSNNDVYHFMNIYLIFFCRDSYESHQK